MNISIILEAALLSKNYGCPWFWMPGFRIYQGYTGFWIHLNIPEQILNILDYAWICLNMADYARISVKPVVTYSSEVYSLTEHEAVFLKGQKLIFAIVAWLFDLLFLLDYIFVQERFQIFCCYLCCPREGDR